ncbi:hypothetical protein [Pseudomonas sp. BF-RE-24]|uniref:hypothetical protein n=1 Tax=Pseudomonas sp. BF-RE-24 TaxID=2832381 RepID=UPI001CBEC198|nr:hypothetical protein [Pseudomonas sp. BF-RE-24]
MQSVALVPRGISIPYSELARVAGAVQAQLVRDVSPSWNLSASLTAYPSKEDAPINCAFIFVVADAKGHAGLHFRALKPNEPPFAIVEYRKNGFWSVAVSHEVIEMLIDPKGNRLVKGTSPTNPAESVFYLVEVCDPCQDIAFSYEIDGCLVSDFCLPSFYGIQGAGASYTYSGSIQAPLTVGYGGYLTYRDNNLDWYQIVAAGGNTSINGPFQEEQVMGANFGSNIRGALDRIKSAYSGPLSGITDNALKKKLSLRKRDFQVEVMRRDAALEDYLLELGL